MISRSGIFGDGFSVEPWRAITIQINVQHIGGVGIYKLVCIKSMAKVGGRNDFRIKAILICLLVKVRRGCSASGDEKDNEGKEEKSM